jgi:hypothetical protein
VPKGVSQDFLRILEADARAGIRRIWTLGVLALLLFAPAWYLADREGTAWWGLVLHAVALGLAVGAGLLWGQRRLRAYEESLRSAWRDWMDYSLACETIPDLYARARGRSRRNVAVLAAVVLFILWALELWVLTMALMEEPSRWWAFAAVAGNAALAGALAGMHIRIWRWTRGFRNSLGDMMASGELGMWGVR